MCLEGPLEQPAVACHQPQAKRRARLGCFETVSHSRRICDHFPGNPNVLLRLAMDPSTKPKLNRGDSAFLVGFIVCSLIAGADPDEKGVVSSPPTLPTTSGSRRILEVSLPPAHLGFLGALRSGTAW